MFGVTLNMDGCYWFRALQAPLHCKSSSAFPCPTSKEQSNFGLRPSHGKGLVRGYFGHWWLLLVWSSARATSVQKQFSPTSEEEHNPGLGPSHGKGLVRGYFGHGWLLLVWSSARATSLQQQFCHSSTLPNQVTGNWALFGVTGLRPSHGKGLVRGYFRHWWLLLVWRSHFCKSSSAFPRPCPTSEEQSNFIATAATSLQQQFHSSTLPNK